MPLSKSQIELGNSILKELSERWAVDQITVATILLDVQVIKEKYNWVNLEDFLLDFLEE